MSGGVALIAGGGALLGAVTGGGAATLGTWVLANQDAYVLNTCAKLIVFCRDVLMESTVVWNSCVRCGRVCASSYGKLSLSLTSWGSSSSS